VVAVKNLLTKDLFAPDYEGQNLSGAANREVMQNVVSYWDMDTVYRQQSHTAWSLGSSKRNKTSSADIDEAGLSTAVSASLVEESAVEGVLQSLNEILKPRHPHYGLLTSVGTSLTQDTFLVKGVTQGRPLTISALLIMRKYDLFRSLGLGEKQFARWLITVEQG
jgi:hypothetical protein